MMIRRIKTGAGAAALAAVLAGGLAACGDDDGGGPDAEFTTAAPDQDSRQQDMERYGFLHSAKNRDIFGDDKDRGGYDLDSRYCWDNKAVTDEVRRVFRGSEKERLFTTLQQTNEQCSSALTQLILQPYAELDKLDANGDKWIDQDELTKGLGRAEYFIPAFLDYGDIHLGELPPDLPVTSPYKRKYIPDETTSTPTPRYTPAPTPTPEPEPQQQQSAWPDPPYPASGNKEWAKKGPFASTYTCGQAADNENPGINISECFTGPDGNAYYYFLRQAAR